MGKLIGVTRIYTDQEKSEAIQVAVETSAREASRLMRPGVTTIRKWMREAGLELRNPGGAGRGGGGYASKWSPEQQAAAVERSTVVGVRQAAAEVGCSPSMVSGWRKRAGVTAGLQGGRRSVHRERERRYISAWCEPELAAAVRERAEAEGVSPSEVVRRALAEFVG